MEMQFKNEIKKLADIVVWAENEIQTLKEELTEEEFDECYEAKDLETVKKVVLESMERHSVYTSALNKDLSDKAAKIDLLEKEIEGRKEGYTALKELMDTKYISIEEHNNICKTLGEKVERQRENLDSINKTLEIKTKENERLIAVKKNQDREIAAHEEENKRLSKKIIELKRAIEKCKDYDTSLIDSLRINNDDLKKQNEYLKKERDKHMARVNDLRMELDCVKASKEKHEEAARDKTIEDLRESFNYWRTQCLAAQEARDAFMKEAEELKEENSRLNARVKCDTEYWKKAFEAQSKELEGYKDRDENAKDLLNNNSKEIKELKDENSYLKKESKNKSEMIRKAYVRYVDEACKSREEIMNECYEKLTKDDTGYTGFKQYTLRALEAQEGDEKKTKEFLCDSAEIIFYNKRAEEKRKEEAKKELNEAFGVPCGSDSIE